MEMRWSLNELYSSFECDEFKNDLAKCNDIIDTMIKWSNENLQNIQNPAKTIKDYMNLDMEFSTIFERLFNFANLTTSVDAKNQTALNYCDKLDIMLTKLTKPNVLFEKYLGNVKNLDEIIASDDLLKEHSFYLKELANKSKYLLSEEEEIAISKMKTTGSTSWSKLQDILTSNLLVDIELDGEQKHLPLPVIRNLAYDKDPIIRQKAYSAELKAYKKIDESSAACLNGIKGEVLTLSEMRGYESPLAQTLFNSRMDKETLDAMLSAMKEKLPVFHKYLKAKGEILGHKNGLPFYDIFAPIGDVDIKYTYEEARKYIVDNFKTFSDKLANFADNAFEKNWIDAEPREGKRGGAFCAGLHSIGESRILANFNNTYNNMTTLAHELGHGYHGSCLKNESILNSDYPMPIAETASIFCETIVGKAALKSATDEEAFCILEQSVSSATQVIVDIYSRYLFESKVFEVRKDHALSVEEFNEIMLNAQKEAYGDGLDHSVLHPYMWVCKPHYYYADANFYNFPYAFGDLFAKGLYAEYVKKGDSFIDEYDKLLAATGKNDIPTITSMVNIDIRSKEFWKSSLDVIEEDINKFIELSKKL
ncbi:M3 family oligoendopeptidase [Abyssisolibacter fermentans]|uniref:M3 family oligoendopeptidase n=1 Tax=Abyssisolibacter fermentans TaxID=1766203 RepID=UPI00082EE27B|nr:M3 family oligoendopeptidase [Abyssisolibacter fermentans]